MDKETVSESPQCVMRLNLCEIAHTEMSTANQGSNDESDEKCKSTTRRRAQISDSDSDNKENNHANINNSLHLPSDSDDEDHSRRNSNILKPRTRIRNYSTSSSDSNDSENMPSTAVMNPQHERLTNKRNEARNKFKKFLHSRSKTQNSLLNSSQDCNEDDIDNKILRTNDESRIVNKDQALINLPIFDSICDPDTSEDEETLPKVQKKRNLQKSTKSTLPKPTKMTAKQAMDNMKKIKSESNRMLREKEISLPYHKPKAISLKDIMSRRKPAVGTDGKALRINMSDDQLKFYVSMLEQRQKEIIELCKSDSEEDEQNISEETTADNDGQTKQDLVSENGQQKEQELNGNILLANVKDDNVNKRICSKDVELDSDKLYNSVVEDVKVQNNTNIEKIDSNILDNTPSDMINHTNFNNEKKHVDIATKINNSNILECKMNIYVNETGSNILTVNTEMVEINCIGECTESIIKNITESHNDIKKDETDEILHSLQNNNQQTEILKTYTESDSQLVALHYDSEKYDQIDSKQRDLEQNVESTQSKMTSANEAIDKEINFNNFSDDELNIDDIDRIIENAEIIKDNNHEFSLNSPMLINSSSTNKTPKITGAPGTVIDLNGSEAIVSKKLTGIDLLKERFTYFATLKTPEETEREKEKKIKPGTLHLKLKKELEEKIAKQRSLEWEKRLQDIKHLRDESDTIMRNNSDLEEDIEKVEAELEKEVCDDKDISDSESETEPEENDVCIEDKPRKKNPLLDVEAEESDIDENNEDCASDNVVNSNINESSEEESSDSDNEEEINTSKKGRILKAFEDSDDDIAEKEGIGKLNKSNEVSLTEQIQCDIEAVNTDHSEINSIKTSQDDELQLAQKHNSLSEDLFTSQDSAILNSKHELNMKTNISNDLENGENDLGTQTFSILEPKEANQDTMQTDSNIQKNLSDLCDNYTNLNHVIGLCPESFSQNLQSSESQNFGEDVLALCTGNFYDNQFVSQIDSNASDKIIQKDNKDYKGDILYDKTPKFIEENIDKDIIDELNDPEFDKPKQHVVFMDNNINQTTEKDVNDKCFKKKLVIDSDDEVNEVANSTSQRKKKKLKKKRLEKRILQISDDEEDVIPEEIEEESEDENDANRLIEYDSEENEVEILPEKKKKRKMADFFEQEAELTSEDEWVGSGDEDEAGLDQMEREEGDDEIFHQGKLQRELGQIHMRDVMDQDKREVRIIQELLFEDGDLGEGHRQRKFRWRNADGEEEIGTVPDEFADTQEEEFESEEQWRKQRHEREVFLRQLKVENEPKESPTVTPNRSTIIKANLCSKTMSSLLMEGNTSTAQKTESPVVEQKKTARDIPSPKKPFSIFQQTYHGSLLSRGQSALARLAALATPLVTEDDTKVGALPPASKRNFVFASVTIEDKEPKATKRKADKCVETPKLLKKMKTEEKKHPRNSLLDHLR